jgi:hypothetical protein
MQIVAIGLLVVVVVVVGPTSLAADAVQDLADDVERNEKYYEELRLALTSVYTSHRKYVKDEPKIKHEAQTSIDLQGQRFREHRKVQGRFRVFFSSSHSGTTESIDVFDGKIHRRFWTNDLEAVVIGDPRRTNSGGHVSDQPPSLTNLARPHMFLLESGCPKVPLSTYLRGHEAVRMRENPDYFSKNSVIKVRHLGDAEFQGLRCIKILIDTGNLKGTFFHGWELWLAKQRNLIPVRNAAYTYRWSKDIPVAVSTVDEWKEIRRGVWFPVKAHTDRYDSHTVKQEGTQKLRWRKQYHIDSVTLNPPRTNPETFTKLDFPPGIQLTILKGGKTTKVEAE